MSSGSDNSIHILDPHHWRLPTFEPVNGPRSGPPQSAISTGIVNEHLTYAVVAAGLGVIGAGNYYGLDATLGPRVGAGVRRWLFSGDVHDDWRSAS